MSEIVVTQHIAAPREVVYDFLTQSDKWQRWQGESAELDAQPGGIFALTMENGMRAKGQFVELVTNERVVFTWGWVDHPGIPPGSTVVTIELVEDEGNTLLVLTHRNLPGDQVDSHRRGWEQYLPGLATTVQKR